MEAAAAGTARCSGPRARSTTRCGKRPSGPTRPRARSCGGSITWRRPCAAGPLPQGTQTVRREPRRRQGETHSSPRALFERDARPWQSPPCTLPLRRGRYHMAQGHRPCAAGPLPQGTHGLNDGSRAAGKARRAARRVLSSSAMHGRDDRCPARAHEPSHAIVVRAVSHALFRPLYASVWVMYVCLCTRHALSSAERSCADGIVKTLKEKSDSTAEM